MANISWIAAGKKQEVTQQFDLYKELSAKKKEENLHVSGEAKKIFIE